MGNHSPDETTKEEKRLRTRAIRRIKRKRHFLGSVLVFLVVNAGLWIGWAVDGAETDNLWPAWVTGIWLGVLMLIAFSLYGERPITDRQIEREMRRMKGSRPIDPG